MAVGNVWRHVSLSAGGRGHSGLQWVEDKDAAKPPTVNSTTLFRDPSRGVRKGLSSLSEAVSHAVQGHPIMWATVKGSDKTRSTGGGKATHGSVLALRNP